MIKNIEKIVGERLKAMQNNEQDKVASLTQILRENGVVFKDTPFGTRWKFAETK